MNENSQLTIIVPAFDEEKNLKDFLPPLLSYCRQNNWRIILVNDGSRDQTKAYLKNYEQEPILTVLHHKLNKGYGAAIKSGIRACETEYLITYDADGQHFLEDIEKLRCCLMDNDADMVVGSRKGLKSSIVISGSGW